MRRMVFILLLFFAASVFAQEHQHGDHHAKDELGEVNFPISCKPESQIPFNRAVALLHDFWYAEAEKSFQQIAASDPDCAMAYWGVAMSNYHPLWAPPNEKELKNGQEPALKALAMEAKTEREKAYIKAIAAFYTDADKVDHKSRAKLYAQEMANVHQQNPEDHEAAIFHALGLLGTANISDKTFATQKEAAAILNPLVEKLPNHPGIAHYIIHSFDYPPLAELALPAARTYAKIAPSSPHALHMPSHIFTRLGLWEESIQSNLASAEKAKRHVQSTMPEAGSFDQLHAMDYLVYAYLQLGQVEKANKVAEEARTIPKLDLNNFAAAYAYAAMPARLAVEGHDWKKAASLQLEPKWFPWDKFPYTEAITHYAVGIGSARSGDLAKAKKAEARLNELFTQLESTDPYWATQVQIQQQTVAAWIAFAEGKHEDGLKRMKAAAALEDTTEKHAVTPGAIMPAHELVAEMLLETNDPVQAKVEFEKALKVSPNRRHQALHNTPKTSGTKK
jgi:tetratricopeptide (TPR) repeat protein